MMFRMMLFVVAVLLAGPVQASMCGPADKVLTHMKTAYGEVPANIATVGTPAGVATMTIVVNPSTGTWTMLVHGKSGTMCSIDIDGENWTTVPPELVPEPQKFRPERPSYFIRVSQ